MNQWFQENQTKQEDPNKKPQRRVLRCGLDEVKRRLVAILSSLTIIRKIKP